MNVPYLGSESYIGHWQLPALPLSPGQPYIRVSCPEWPTFEKWNMVLLFSFPC
jgi:hypothetical protein